MIKQLWQRKKANQTVLTVTEMAQLMGRPADANFWSKVSYYTARGELKRLAKGLYVLGEEYESGQVANRLRQPSYVSLYTVLREEGVIFQPYEAVYSVGKRSETVRIDGIEYRYRKIKDEILYNQAGIRVVRGVIKATIERAILDWIYLDGPQGLDNDREVGVDRLRWLNKRVYRSRRIQKYLEVYAK